MRVPFGWLREFVKIDVTPEELSEALIMLGFSDAEVIPNEWGVLESFVVGRVGKVTAHPSDGHLKVVTVNVGYADLVSVCGAPVIEEGKLYAVALPGAKLGTGRAVDAAKVGGILSQCVLCSGKEAWIDESKDELLQVDDDITPGADLAEALGLLDPVIQLEVTPNRGDWLGMVGIAREIAAIFGKDLLIPEPGLHENGTNIGDLVSVEVADTGGCPRYGALVCEEVVVKGSSARARARLRLAGMRPINNIVDATNLVLLETGHPLHAFDLDKIAGRRIVVRRAAAGEKIVAIDGNQYDLCESDLVIADSSKPVAVAGVIGGQGSEVTESTKRILIEGAFFDHCSVWKTAKRLGLVTEASYRFERGVDLGAVPYVLARAGSLIQPDTKCRVGRGRIDIYPRPVRDRRFFVSPKRINRLLGTSIPEQEICDYLESLGFTVAPGKDLEVIVPARRSDVECEADIAEDVARLYGYDRIGEKTTLTSQIYARLPQAMRRTREMKHILEGMGVFEIVTDSMVGPGDLEAFNLDSDARLDIRNPIGVQTSCLRPSLIPGVVKVLANNEFNGQEGTAVFEMGKVFLKSPDEPREPYRLAIGLSGAKQSRSWYSKAVEFDFYDLKGIVETLGDLAGVRIEARESDRRTFHPGRRMELVLAQDGVEKSLGWLGEILPSITEGLGSKRRAYAAEIDLAPLVESAARVARFEEIPRHPAVKRDTAVVVSESVRESDVRKAILAAAGELMETVEVFDLYRGEQIPKGTKSLAYGMIFRSESRTLKEEEVDSIQRRIEERLSQEFGAKIRDK